MKKSLLIFDVTNSKMRRKLIKFVENAGLFRIQKSAFLGESSSYKIKELIDRINRFLKEEKIIVHIFEINSKDFEKLKEIRINDDNSN
jgi:CRISPR-associated protein Cas2